MTRRPLPLWFRRVLDQGATGNDVAAVQRKLGLPVTCFYDPDTAAAVRGVQRRVGLRASGVVDDATALALGESASAHLAPEWFSRTLRLHLGGDDVAALRARLDLPEGTRFTHEVDAAVRRLQSSLSIVPDGVVDEALAILIGE